VLRHVDEAVARRVIVSLIDELEHLATDFQPCASLKVTSGAPRGVTQFVGSVYVSSWPIRMASSGSRWPGARARL